ncbi:Rieske (2Fe-2S) protein [Nocardioides plantarum]|uniref:Rieske (2Fe-2S) protein n=1 Tax=Nocardioides plantarum TaxID=29299 RepID=A0ABV5K5S1_9ACTN|nr:Rieske (2Fe-2S) protein [Nocardioides plantarum]
MSGEVTTTEATTEATTETAPARHSRRLVFQGMGALGVACVLAACGGGSDDGGSSGGGAAPEAGASLIATAEVPVGGGVVVSEANLVVTQPTEGDFKAFTTACTHQGTPVNQVDGADIICPNHGSRFSITDGSALKGPATTALSEVQVKVQGDQVVVA